MQCSAVSAILFASLQIYLQYDFPSIYFFNFVPFYFRFFIFFSDLPDSPVLFAVDEYNTWEAPSAFHYRMKPVFGKEICVPHALNFLGVKKANSENYTMKNGLCVGSASSRYPDGLKIQYEDAKSSIPLVIRVPAYSQIEMASCVSYYQEQNIIDQGMNTLDVVTYRMQSG